MEGGEKKHTKKAKLGGDCEPVLVIEVIAA